MIAGTVYGVVLNDRLERQRLEGEFTSAPYKAPPAAPVVYIKPRNCFASPDTCVSLDADIEEVEVAATIALLFGRDTTMVSAAEAMSGIAAACLAIDIAVPHASYYRPAIAQRCRDGFLPIGDFGGLPLDPHLTIVTRIDGQESHAWSLDRLVRPIGDLIADLSAFMTLRAGDMLMVGLAGDAPKARRGQHIAVSTAGLATLRAVIGGRP